MRILRKALLVAFILGTHVTLLHSAVFAQPEHLDIVGNSAIVIDAETGAILYADRANEPLAPASLTKIFTAYFAIEATPLQRRMSVVKDDLVGEASAGLNAGDNLSLETLLHGLLLSSGNDSAMTIARNVGQSHAPSGLNGVTSFTGYANARLAALGLTGTRLANPHGLDEPGHVSTAHDIAAITMLALQSEPDFLRIVSSPGYSGEGTSFSQRNQLIGAYPGALGGKTGITDDAGYCLMSIAHRDGRTLISVVLGSTADAWYSDSVALLDQGFRTPTADKPTVSLSAGQQMPLFAQTPASIQGLAIHVATSDAISVRPALGASTSSWSVLRWPVGTVLGMLVALVTFIQMRALIELQKRPMAKGRRPRTRSQPPVRPRTHHTPDRATGTGYQETQPFAAVPAWRMPVTSWSAGTGD